MNKSQKIIRMGICLGLVLHLGLPSGNAGAGPGRRPTVRPNVSRDGPARHGSLQNRGAGRSPEGRGPDRDRDLDQDRTDRQGRYDREDRYGGQQDRVERLREVGAVAGERADRADRLDPSDRPDSPEEARRRYGGRESVRDERRDYYEDRRVFRRGAVYYSSWWSTSCRSAQVVEVDGYTYYQCEGAWFSQTYYGGEVIYTVTDPPPGY